MSIKVWPKKTAVGPEGDNFSVPKATSEDEKLECSKQNWFFTKDMSSVSFCINREGSRTACFATFQKDTCVPTEIQFGCWKSDSSKDDVAW